MRKSTFAVILLALFPLTARAADQTLRNDRYTLTLLEGGSVRVTVPNLPPRTLTPSFTVMRSDKDPGYHANHYNYTLAPRTAVRWPEYQEDLPTLNAYVNSPDLRPGTAGATAKITEDAKGARTWTYTDDAGKTIRKFTGPYAQGTINPFVAGQQITPKFQSASLADSTIRWTFSPAAPVTLSATITLPPGDADPAIRWDAAVSSPGYYSVLFTGAPTEPASSVLPIPQECAGRGFRQANFVCAEGYLKLPRAHLATADLNSAIVVDSSESPFRLVDRANSRFGLMLHRKDGQVRPIAVAPLMGGAESKMSAGSQHHFTLRYVLRPGDWKDTYRHIARALYAFRDQRDNTGPGSLNATLERIFDYVTDRNGANHAMWHAEQKYFDYWCDKSGVVKPFSPLFGLSAAIVTDDERFYRTRALPQVEFALSRRSNTFQPYDLADNGMISNPSRALGGPYIPAAQVASLGAFFHNRNEAFRAYESEAPKSSPTFIAALGRYRTTKDPAALAEAKKLAAAALKNPGGSYADWLEIYDATGDDRFLAPAVNAAYRQAADINLFPAVPDADVTMDTGGVPVHLHSFGRHKLWGFPDPTPFALSAQTVPAWRVALTGLTSPAYRGEYWMDSHGQLMRLAALAGDDFLRDVARWGVVGRFGNYPGDNRSRLSLVAESPDAVENPMWKLTFATINPGHAWDFAAQLLDFLVSDAFHRSAKQIDFPAETTNGSAFQVRVYGAAPGRFYDEQNVHLWLPRKLLTLDNKQIDYLAGYGNGKLYLALWNQSFKDEPVAATINPDLAPVTGPHTARVWTNNTPVPTAPLTTNTLTFTLPAKGIIAYAIDNVPVKTTLQTKILSPDAPKLGPASVARTDAPFGKVHAMLLSPGKGLTTAFVYTDALPENTIEARLHYRQGTNEWKTVTDTVFPYEFSFDYDDANTDNLELVFEVETANQQLQHAPLLTLNPSAPSPIAPNTAVPSFSRPARGARPSAAPIASSSDQGSAFPPDFLTHMKQVTNPQNFGLKNDRFYPYSSRFGRRIAYRLPVTDESWYHTGLPKSEAESLLRAALAQTRGTLRTTLAAKYPDHPYDKLPRESQEILFDLAHTQGPENLPDAVYKAVLTKNWPHLINDCLYVRAPESWPDIPANNAFAKRWIFSNRLIPAPKPKTPTKSAAPLEPEAQP